jgi:phosphinothricin acetyltransferase
MADIRPATAEDLPAINAIYNEVVEHSTACFDLEPISPAQREAWFDAHGDDRPILVAEQAGRVVGWAGLHTFIHKQGSRHVAELSVYVDRARRSQGIGRRLMEAILLAGESAGVRQIVAYIAGGNEVSVHLHQSMGFRHVGVLEGVGFKFGRYVDVTIMQRSLG